MSEHPDDERNEPKPLTGRQTYNLVTDTIVGPNVRFKDNLFQAIAIFACLILGAVVGLFIAKDAATGLLVGGLAGLLVGLFGSGIFLMIYRAVKHARGEHD